MASIPVIDISALCNTGFDEADQSAKDLAIQQICKACKDVGFFYLTGHGVDQSTFSHVFSDAKNFFALQAQKKNAISVHNSPSYNGYIEIETERTQNVVDIREGFYFQTNSSSNQLPNENDLPGFADTLMGYAEQVTRLGFLLMKAFAIGIGLPDDYFDDKLNAQSTLGYFHYPPHPAETKSWGVGPHTDYGMFTFLLQDEIGGLEVEITEGQWIDAKPIPGTFVVNLGDCLQIWSKGLYRATKHRVRHSVNTDRYSVALFFNPKEDVTIKPIETEVTRNLTHSNTVKGSEIPFRFGDFQKSLRKKSHDWSKNVSSSNSAEK